MQYLSITKMKFLIEIPFQRVTTANVFQRPALVIYSDSFLNFMQFLYSTTIVHSQVKVKSYHFSFCFWAICGSDVTLRSISAMFTSGSANQRGLFTSDVITTNRAWALIGQTRFYFSPVGLFWLYFIRLCIMLTKC